MKKWLRLLLAMVMLLTLMAGLAVMAGAEETYKHISDVYCSITGRPDALIAGQPLPEVKVSPAREDTRFTMSCTWLDGEENEIPAGTIAVFGETYRLRIKAIAEEGYMFDQYTWMSGTYDKVYPVGSLGAGAPELWGDTDFTAYHFIERAELTLAKPEVGQPLQMPVAVGENFSVSTVDTYWVNYPENDSGETDTVAKAGYLYYLSIMVEPAPNYTFTQDTEVFINGKRTSFSINALGNIFLVQSYDLRILLDACAFDLAEIVPGQPFPQAVVAEDAGYTVTTSWEDMYTEKLVEEDALVAEGGIYRVRVKLYADERHTVSGEATVTVNGAEPVGYYNADPYTHSIEYIEDVCLAQPLEKVEITFTEPAAGVARGEFSVPEGANYSIREATRWENLDDYNDPVDTFIYGNRYALNLYVNTHFGYTITKDTQIYINGELIPADNINNFLSYFYYYADYSLKTVINKVDLPAIPALKVGDTLPTGSGNGENYTYSFVVDAKDPQGNTLTGTTVVEGGTYIVSLFAIPNNGFEFAQDVEITIGGKPRSNLRYVDSDMIAILQTYSFGGYELIDEISLGTTIPWIGQSKGGKISIDESAGYILETSFWYVSTSDNIEYADKLTQPLQAGQRVLLELMLETKDGYLLSHDVKILVNGREYPAVLFMSDAIKTYVILDLGEAADPSGYNGLIVVDDTWGYYIDGVLQTEYTGLVPFGDNLFYVEDGILDFSYTGLAWYNDAWTYVANSVLTEGYTGLVWFEGEWFYTVDSVIDWTFTGLVSYNGNMFYIQNNHLNWGYTGLAYLNDGWYYVESALLKPDFTGLTYFNDNWFYVVDGTIDWTFTGMVPYNDNFFYVQNNLLDWSYTGLGYHDGGWYYFQNALYTTTFTGLVPFNGSLFYVSSGTIDWTYNGEVEYDGVTYTVIDGAVTL